jgi:hypothetical protein
MILSHQANGASSAGYYLLEAKYLTPFAEEQAVTDQGDVFCDRVDLARSNLCESASHFF